MPGKLKQLSSLQVSLITDSLQWFLFCINMSKFKIMRKSYQQTKSENLVARSKKKKQGMSIHFWFNIVCNVDTLPDALFFGKIVLLFCMQHTLSRYIFSMQCFYDFIFQMLTGSAWRNWGRWYTAGLAGG